ncbi:hypothetical protein DUI87_15106 [Hirundo rustica rustica]|uniref:Uncharacterized protein n=1 Tax=Hirundo rustica rustica TaxID=333673 RepID=A0A3M0K476_HIRRU|nr:hypothetical protein DUI87_15106 [Hirundo rustica rustica]
MLLVCRTLLGVTAGQFSGSSLLCPVLGFVAEEGEESTGVGPGEVTERIWALEHLCAGHRLRELGLVRLQKGRLRAGPINPYQHLQGGPEHEARLCSVVPGPG